MSTRGRLFQNMRGAKDGRPRRQGQGLVEFALILPILLLLIFVLVEAARLLHAWLAIENGARFGIRYAVTGEYDMEACGGPCGDDVVARLESIKDAAETGASSVMYNLGIDTSDSSNWDEPGAFKTTICPPSSYQAGNASNPIRFAQCTGGDNGADPGELVSVTVDFNHPLITPFLSSIWPQIHLTSRREAVVESFRTTRTIGMPPEIPEVPPEDTATATQTSDATSTATMTATATVIDKPECGQLLLAKDDTGYDFIEVFIYNYNPTWPAYLARVWLDTDDIGLVRQTFQGASIGEWNPPAYGRTENYDLMEGPIIGDAKFFWRAYFNDAVQVPGYLIETGFNVDFHYGDGQVENCYFYRNWSFEPTPTQGPTPTASLTPTWGPSLTPTDTQEVVATDTLTPTFTQPVTPTNTPTPKATLEPPPTRED